MEIKELMTDDFSLVNEFEEACNEMLSCRYILAEARVIKILQTIAISNVLQNVIGGALKGFDYLATARTWSDNGKFIEPSSEKEYVALTMCILADVDSGKIVLSDFLRQFFWDGSINDAYIAFCNMLVEPFKRYVVDAAMRATKDFSSVEELAQAIADGIDRMDLDFADKSDRLLLCDSAAKARLDVEEAKESAAKLGQMLMGTELEPLVNELIAALNA